MLTLNRRRMSAWFGLIAACLAGCGPSAEESAATITLATTTSMQDSGMLDALLPEFKQRTGIEVQVVAVGSGQAMELGRRGDADVLITHSPIAEQKFVDEGYGIEQQPVMFNDFVLVGPEGDPARVASAESVAGAFGRMAEAKHGFLSRGDDSGTHQKELAIWRAAETEPAGDWYLKGGVGMAQALRLASERNAYTLTDRGTYLAMKGELGLQVWYEGDPLLQNPYSVTVINPEKHPGTNVAAARAFAEFLRSPTAKQLIAEFGVEKFGKPLFQPIE